MVPSSSILDAIVHPTAESYLAEVIGGLSPLLSTDRIAMRARTAWEKLTEKPKSEVCFRIIEVNGKTTISLFKLLPLLYLVESTKQYRLKFIGGR